MSEIPKEYRRILEQDVDNILRKHLSSFNSFSCWFFSKVFSGGCLLSITSVKLNVEKDFRKAYDNPMAYGETDVEVIGIISQVQISRRVAILIEDKVDADQMPYQGLRYKARAECDKQAGSWADYRCILIGPRSYLDSKYPDGDHDNDAWDAVLSLEEIASGLLSINKLDANKLIAATQTANSWNKPIPSAVKFWKDYAVFQHDYYPSIPVFIKTTRGSRAGGVWPSFFDDSLRNNSTRPKRKRVQIVHMDTSSYVTLFIKKVAYESFEKAVIGIIEPDMNFGKPGGSWQSIQIPVSNIDVLQPLDIQRKQLNEVFMAAKRLFDFYLKYEDTFLSIPLKLKA